MHLTLDSADGAALGNQNLETLIMNIVWCLPTFGSLFFKSDITGQKETILRWGTNYKGLLNNLLHKLLCRCSMAWASLELDFLVKICDFWFILWTMGSETFTPTFLRISLDPFNSISGDFWWTYPRTCGQRWCGLCNLSAAPWKSLSCKRRWKEMNFPSISQTPSTYQFHTLHVWFSNFGSSSPASCQSFHWFSEVLEPRSTTGSFTATVTIWIDRRGPWCN